MKRALDMEIIPDTSAIIEGIISEWLENGKFKGKVYIHRAVISELSHQANIGKITGFLGLEEIRKIREFEKKGVVTVEIVGDYPTKRHIEMAKLGEIDLLIIEYAYNEGIKLLTADRVQMETARAMGVDVIYVEPKSVKKLEFERFFDENTMSIHLKEGSEPMAKKGSPGRWKFVKLSDEKIPKDYLEKLSMQIIEFSRQDPESFIEIDRPGTTIVQLRNYRIIICRPPFSDGWEITIVKPIKKLSIEEYNLPKKLLERLKEKAEGILISGPPGAGKCVTGDTLIETDRGRITARELYELLNKGNEVKLLSLRMNAVRFRKVKRFYKRKAKILVKITTRSGKEITLTPNHKILAISHDVGWISASQIKKGDCIAAYGEDEFVPVTGVLKKFFDGKFVKKREIEEITIKRKLSIDLLSKLSLITNRYIRWEVVKDVRKEIREEEVYDFEVEDTHNFIANGLVIHNSTFAQALAEFYAREEKIVKTIESPRDLILSQKITQYSKNYGTSEEIHDVLLLSRPDYTIFDEMRDDEDFKLYMDMRLAGVGMVGVVHASSPIDAIQRFIRRAELGQIPSIIDTVIFIEGGKVKKVYSVEMTVKVPTGLVERELSRPVIEVRDYLTGELEYEIYKFGEETSVIPVKRLKKRRIEKIIEGYGIERWEDLGEKIVVYIDKKKLKKLKGKKIRNLEKKLMKRFGKRVEIEVL